MITGGTLRRYVIEQYGDDDLLGFASYISGIVLGPEERGAAADMLVGIMSLGLRWPEDLQAQAILQQVSENLLAYCDGGCYILFLQAHQRAIAQL